MIAVIRMSAEEEARWCSGDPDWRRQTRNELRERAHDLMHADERGVMRVSAVEIHFADGVCADVVYAS